MRGCVMRGCVRVLRGCVKKVYQGRSQEQTGIAYPPKGHGSDLCERVLLLGTRIQFGRIFGGISLLSFGAIFRGMFVDR